MNQTNNMSNTHDAYNSNIIPNTDNTYTLGTSSKRWAAIHVGLSTIGEDITTRNLDVSGIGTIGSGSSGQAFLQYQGATKLQTENWGTRVSGTLQTIGGRLESAHTGSQTEGYSVKLLNLNGLGGTKGLLEIGHTSNNSFITGHVGNISINAPTVSISTDFSVAGISTFTGAIKLKADVLSGSSTNRIYIGAGDDLTLFHDSANSYLQNHTGDLIIGDTNHAYLRGYTSDKSVALFFNNSNKIQTTNTGVVISGICLLYTSPSPRDS